MSDNPTEFIGTVFIPGNPGSPVGKFNFTLTQEGRALDAEIGSFVSADTAEGSVVGTVTDMSVIGSEPDPIKANLRDYGGQPMQADSEVFLGQASVLQSDKQRPVRRGAVRYSTNDEIISALGQDNMSWGIPVGAIKTAQGGYLPINIDGTYVVGPEGQGLIVGGKSGLASKTSFFTVALKSTMHQARAEGLRCGALIFNVKGQDMLFMDEPPAAGYELSDKDFALYETMGIPAEPFPNVTVYSPANINSLSPQSSREDARIMRWDLKMVWDYLPAIFDSDTKNTNLDNLMADVYAAFVETDVYPTINKLTNWLETEIDAAEDPDSDARFWKAHHPATARVLLKRLRSLIPKFKGLLTGGKADSAHDVPDRGWLDNEVVVVDIAGLPQQVQAAVMARTITRVFNSAENNTLGVDRLPIIADELNKWAPRGGERSPIKDAVQGIATRARYSGLGLFAAGQMLSQVDTLVRDNSGTKALGLSEATEVSSGVYGKLPSGIAEKVETLPKGQMLLWHYTFRQPIVVEFPRPAWRTGKAEEKGSRKTAVDSLELDDAVVATLSEGLTQDQVDNIIAAAQSTEQAIADLTAARTPDLRKTAIHSSHKPQIHSDPFGLGDD